MKNNKWYLTASVKPEQNKIVEAMDSGGNVQKLIYSKNLWWFKDMSMYVYYTPERWRYLE